MMKIKYIQYFIVVPLIFIFSGCTLYPNNFINDSTNFSSLSYKLVKRLKPVLQQHVIPSDTPALVADFVNLDTLTNNSKLGFLLADLVKNELVSKYQIPVREVKLSRDFMLGKSGFKMLSHNVKEVNAQIVHANYALIGSYTFTNEQIIITLKVIDVRTGLLIGSSMVKNIITPEILQMESTQSIQNIYTPTVL